MEISVTLHIKIFLNRYKKLLSPSKNKFNVDYMNRIETTLTNMFSQHNIIIYLSFFIIPFQLESYI